MKIKDYKLFLESIEDIHSICRKILRVSSNRVENYTINEDGTVDVDGDVYLSGKNLQKIPLNFGRVTGDFECDENKLTSLEGCPNWVGGYFSCCNNYLKTLEGGPKWVSRYFSCRHNELTTLEGGPVTVLGNYYCNNNQLVNFKGFPEDFDNNNEIDIENNYVYDLIENIPEEKWNKFIYWCNEFDVINSDGKVIPDRMYEVYHKLGLKYEN